MAIDPSAAGGRCSDGRSITSDPVAVRIAHVDVALVKVMAKYDNEFRVGRHRRSHRALAMSHRTATRESRRCGAF
jgi:hypothetical protein